MPMSAFEVFGCASLGFVFAAAAVAFVGMLLDRSFRRGRLIAVLAVGAAASVAVLIGHTFNDLPTALLAVPAALAFVVAEAWIIAVVDDLRLMNRFAVAFARARQRFHNACNWIVLIALAYGNSALKPPIAFALASSRMADPAQEITTMSKAPPPSTTTFVVNPYEPGYWFVQDTIPATHAIIRKVVERVLRHHPEICREAIQNTWVRLLEAEAQPLENANGYVYVVARNESWRLSRQMRHLRGLTAPMPDDDLLADLMAHRLDEANMWIDFIKRLNEQQCRFVVLALQDSSVDHIALALDISRSSAYRMRDAIKAIVLEIVGSDGPPDGPGGGPGGSGGRTNFQVSIADGRATVELSSGAEDVDIQGRTGLDCLLSLPAFSDDQVVPRTYVVATIADVRFHEVLELTAFQEPEPHIDTSWSLDSIRDSVPSCSVSTDRCQVLLALATAKVALEAIGAQIRQPASMVPADHVQPDGRPMAHAEVDPTVSDGSAEIDRLLQRACTLTSSPDAEDLVQATCQRALEWRSAWFHGEGGYVTRVLDAWLLSRAATVASTCAQSPRPTGGPSRKSDGCSGPPQAEMSKYRKGTPGGQDDSPVRAARRTTSRRLVN